MLIRRKHSLFSFVFLMEAQTKKKDQEEENYMNILTRFDTKAGLNKVCKVRRYCMDSNNRQKYDLSKFTRVIIDLEFK